MLGSLLAIASGIGTGIGAGWLLWGQYTPPVTHPAGALLAGSRTFPELDPTWLPWLLSRAYMGDVDAYDTWRTLYDTREDARALGMQGGTVLELSDAGLLRMTPIQVGRITIQPLSDEDRLQLVEMAVNLLRAELWMRARGLL